MDNEGKQMLIEFERMLKRSELNALSKVSIERPLSDSEHSKIMGLRDEVLHGKA